MNGEAARARQLIQQQVGQLIQENEHAAKALGAMTRRGLTPVEAREEIGRVLLGALWRAAMGRPGHDLDALLDRLAAGARSTDLFPENEEKP